MGIQMLTIGGDMITCSAGEDSSDASRIQCRLLLILPMSSGEVKLHFLKLKRHHSHAHRLHYFLKLL
jgi:hypothetical protein